jgi:hypothetical protein
MISIKKGSETVQGKNKLITSDKTGIINSRSLGTELRAGGFELTHGAANAIYIKELGLLDSTVWSEPVS